MEGYIQKLGGVKRYVQYLEISDDPELVAQYRKWAQWGQAPLRPEQSQTYASGCQQGQSKYLAACTLLFYLSRKSRDLLFQSAQGLQECTKFDWRCPVVSGTGAWVKRPNHLSHRLSSIITDGCHAVFYTIFRDGFGNLNIS